MLKASESGFRVNERFSVRVHAPIKAKRRWRGCERSVGDTGKRCGRHVSVGVFAASEEESQSAKPIPPPPYGKLSVPVYSLATAGVFNGVSKSRASMNITTYATPIAIQPARRFIIALYHGTLSTENMLARGKAVLQILGEQHAELLPLLGKASGHEIDKIALLEERGFETVERYGVPTLASCLGVVELSIVNIQDVGDHDVVLCDVERYEDFASESDLPLYTAKLRELGLIT
eukprot:CAMPEP_0198198862 /NCGR_PEP_ID=MMETSP1445-20131203/2224_1 /TAXON_ID=36898 /ORGANISM="Pyramimonas sp., Strain CCMP2087" /LENGTH=232 /DNA_ID=CAMNT_0043868523 /DNA_START=151 /DNA_END=849 /DNA_ORIENTATION=+